jgi:hypothetical protein
MFATARLASFRVSGATGGSSGAAPAWMVVVIVSSDQ